MAASSSGVVSRLVTASNRPCKANTHGLPPESGVDVGESVGVSIGLSLLGRVEPIWSEEPAPRQVCRGRFRLSAAPANARSASP